MFNGPPRSGKDTAARIAKATCDRLRVKSQIVSVAEPLKNAVHAMYGLAHVPPNYFEDRKDVPAIEMFGAIPRQEYIDLSEKYIKLRNGQDHFARVLTNVIGNSPDVVIISDCGFNAEVDKASESVGRDNLQIVKIIRKGTSFEGDSRQWVYHNGKDLSVTNNSSIVQFEDEVAMLVANILTEWNVI